MSTGLPFSRAWAGECGICLNTIKSTDFVAHSNGGELHPYHRECIKTAMVIRTTCPSCNRGVNTNSLYTISISDRLASEIHSVANDALFGGILGTAAICASGPFMTGGFLLGAGGVTLGATLVARVARAADSAGVSTRAMVGAIVGLTVIIPIANMLPIGLISILGGSLGTGIAGYMGRRQLLLLGGE